jgi:hypothetical protein
MHKIKEQHSTDNKKYQHISNVTGGKYCLMKCLLTYLDTLVSPEAPCKMFLAVGCIQNSCRYPISEALLTALSGRASLKAFEEKQGMAEGVGGRVGPQPPRATASSGCNFQDSRASARDLG